MKTIKEMISIIEAYDKGSKIERRPDLAYAWLPCTKPKWNWQATDYRIAAESVTLRGFAIFDSKGEFVLFTKDQNKSLGFKQGDYYVVYINKIIGGEDE